VRDLAKLEDEAVELGAYANHNPHGLLQTPEYARAPYEMRQPSFTDDEIERYEVAATPDTIRIRDSKHQSGPQLTATPAAWTTFVTYASHG
jgi:hypothetical protein